jgi:hypothetical protein
MAADWGASFRAMKSNIKVILDLELWRTFIEARAFPRSKYSTGTIEKLFLIFLIHFFLQKDNTIGYTVTEKEIE